MERQFLEVLIYGAGGHGMVVADIVERQAEYRIAGFIDDNSQLWGKRVFTYKVLGGLAKILDEKPTRYPIIVAIGENRIREHLVERLDAYGYSFASAIHPSAQIARDVRIRCGAMVMANVSINPGTKIGVHTIINTGAVVDHDCTIHDFVHISPTAALAGNVVVEEGVHIGMGSSILPNVRIGAYSVVGAGAIVTKDIASGLTVIGLPAKPIKVKKT